MRMNLAAAAAAAGQREPETSLPREERLEELINPYHSLFQKHQRNRRKERRGGREKEALSSTQTCRNVLSLCLLCSSLHHNHIRKPQQEGGIT